MAWETALSAAMQVAITTAGFSGVVAAFGRRAAGGWTQADQLLLQTLLTASAAALVFSFLPFVSIDLARPELAWRICSGAYVIYSIGIVIVRRSQHRGSRRWLLHLSPWIFGTVHAFVTVALLANTIWVASSSLYLLAVMWSLGVAFIAFVALLLESWRAPPA